MSTMVATVVSLMQSKAKARRKLVASEPMRPRLLNAAAVGPVALDVIVSYESLGSGVESTASPKSPLIPQIYAVWYTC